MASREEEERTEGRNLTREIWTEEQEENGEAGE
jgi:hypothetical protein